MANGSTCILRFTVASNGTGLSNTVTDGIGALVKYTTLSIRSQPRDDGSLATPATDAFITRVVANVPDDTFKPPAEPERSCTPVPTPATFSGGGYDDDGFTGFAVGSSSPDIEGAKLFFTVHVRNDTVSPALEPQLFTAYVDAIDATTGAVLDSQPVLVIVPAAD